MKETYKVWLALYRDFPKVERLGVGNKIEQAFLDVFELVFLLSYLPPEHKLPMLRKAITRFDVVKFFVQLAWENKLMANSQYADFIKMLEGIGQQLGAWKKGLDKKLLGINRGEKQ